MQPTIHVTVHDAIKGITRHGWKLYVTQVAGHSGRPQLGEEEGEVKYNMSPGSQEWQVIQKTSTAGHQ
jgi:hypothetical protein